MALYTWRSASASDSLMDHLSELGMQICEEACTERQLYAVEASANGEYQYNNRVNVIVSWFGSAKEQCQVEVRSSEPMFKSNTRCEKVAKALRIYAPPTD